MQVNPSASNTPQWKPSAGITGQISSELKRWLLDKGSLTLRLTDQYHGEFNVEILEQHWGTPSADEALALGLSTRDRVLIREVILHGGQQPRVYARSILPSRSLVGRLRALTQLDTRPLGAWLFKQKDLRRDALEVANFAQTGTTLPEAAQECRPGWGRRSVFYVDDKPLLVCEIFLQSLIDDIERVQAR